MTPWTAAEIAESLRDALRTREDDHPGEGHPPVTHIQPFGDCAYTIRLADGSEFDFAVSQRRRAQP